MKSNVKNMGKRMKNKIFCKVFIYCALVLHIGLKAGENSWSWSGLKNSAYNAYNAATVENMTNVMQRWTTKKTVGAFVVLAGLLASYYNFDQILDLLASRIPFPAEFKAWWWTRRAYRDLVEVQYGVIKERAKQIFLQTYNTAISDRDVDKEMSAVKTGILFGFYYHVAELMPEYADFDYKVFREHHAQSDLADVVSKQVTHFSKYVRSNDERIELSIMKAIQEYLQGKKSRD